MHGKKRGKVEVSEEMPRVGIRKIEKEEERGMMKWEGDECVVS